MLVVARGRAHAEAARRHIILHGADVHMPIELVQERGRREASCRRWIDRYGLHDMIRNHARFPLLNQRHHRRYGTAL